MTTKAFYKKTISICGKCAADCPAYYEEQSEKMFFHYDCKEHGHFSDLVEKDVNFFKTGYEEDYEEPANHLSFPITYRCNLKCTYCYTLSNCPDNHPADRSFDEIIETIRSFNGNVSLIGGEPTMRDDLMKIIRTVKSLKGKKRKLSLCTNGQKLADFEYVMQLKKSGLDFVFLSLNDIEYEPNKKVYENKLLALDNCLKLKMPVWLQRTISDTCQLDSISDIIDEYGKTIFFITIRAVKPIGLRYPADQVFLSDMIKFFNKENDYEKGCKFFNRYINFKGKPVMLTSWIMDRNMLDPVDSKYILSDGTTTTFFIGIKKDEALLLKRRNSYGDKVVS